MDIKGLIFSVQPKVTARIIAALVAVAFVIAGIKIAYAIKDNEGEEELPADDSGNVPTDSKEKGEETEKPQYELDFETASSVGSVINGRSAALVDIGNSKIIAEKNLLASVPLRDASVFMTALTVSKAISEGRVTLGEEAVCPASAARSPNYSLSEQVLSIGKRMKVGEILRCMLYQSGSSYAYTLAVHISGSEEGFVKEMNDYASQLSLSSTLFVNCTGDDDSRGTVSAYDFAIILKRVFEDPLLKEILCGNDMLSVTHGQSGSVELVVKNDFFEKYCTESQAKNDGITGGKVSSVNYYEWAAVYFSSGEKEYIALILESKAAFTDALMLYSAYALCT